MQNEQLTEEPTSSQSPAVIGQALLFSPEIEPLIAAEEQKQGLYTAQRFRQQRPEAYTAVVQLLGAGVGMQRIGKLLGIHHMTAAAVRDSEPEAIDIARSKMVTNLRTAINLQVERLIAHPDLVPMNVAGLLIAQLNQQAELLDGRATQRIESSERIDIFANWQEVLEKHLEPGRDVIEIEARPAATGLSGGNRDAIDVEASVAELDLGGDPAARTDAESDGSATGPEATSADATALSTDPTTAAADQAERPDARNEGGGGGDASKGGPSSSIGQQPPKFSANRPPTQPLPPPPV